MNLRIKSNRKECCICGNKCGGELLIRDKKYLRPFESESICCKDCFDAYIKNNDAYLDEKIRQKLNGENKI